VIGEVLDTQDGLFRLTKRSSTFDGSVPLRVARACVPLLEGNGYGLQLTLSRPLLVRHGFGGWRASWADGGEESERRHAGARPRLSEEGYLDAKSGWLPALRHGLIHGSRKGIRVFTGLLVRPAAGAWFRVTSAANRRNTLFEVVEQLIADDGAWVPLVLDLRFRKGTPSAFRLEGELGCLGPLRPGVSFESLSLAAAPELARAHAKFYDRVYFEGKREETTFKYRRLVASEPQTGGDQAACRVASVGASRHAVVPLDGFTTAAGPEPERRPAATRRIETIVFRNEIGFAALYDGHSMTLDYDRARLVESTRPVIAAFRETLAGSAALDHPGSELYLTKYFTPHPPGEPHFFVKPWALTATPPGWSSLLEGVHGEGYDVLRGIVSTDTFHATPAVFRVHREGERVRVAEDAALLRVIPIPRSLLDGEIRVIPLA